MFRAVSYAVMPDMDIVLELRTICSDTIQADPETYTKAILDGREPAEYCKWLLDSDSWGGAIELGILANHFDIEICAVDVQSTQIFRMNEGAARRCIVLYSGIHYDTIVAIPSSSGYVRDPMDDVRQFEEDEEILFKARELALLFNSIDYFTDTGGMKLKCNMCDWIGYGEKAATIHCEQSGHADMEQVKDEK